MYAVDYKRQIVLLKGEESTSTLEAHKEATGVDYYSQAPSLSESSGEPKTWLFPITVESYDHKGGKTIRLSLSSD